MLIFPFCVLFLKGTEERKSTFIFFFPLPPPQMPLFSDQVIQVFSPADRNRELTNTCPKQAFQVLVSFQLSVVLKVWNMELVLSNSWAKDKDQIPLCRTLSCPFWL